MPASSNSFASTVDLRLRPSHRALRLLFALHLVCLGLLPFAMPSGWPMAVLAGAFALSWLRLRRHPALGFARDSISRLVWHGDGGWSLYRGSDPEKAELLAGSLVHPWALVLRFRLDTGGTATRLLLGDEAEPEPLRRVRARLSVAD